MPGQARIIHSVRWRAACRSRAPPGIRRLPAAPALPTASSRRYRHGASLARSTKRCRNSAQMIEPAKPPDGALLMSAILESSQDRRAATAAVATTDRSPLGAGARRRRERLIVGVKGWQIRAQRDPRRAGQGPGRPADRASPRRPAPAHRPGQPSLGVGVADLDREALARGEDVERPEGVAGDRVLDRGDQHPQPNFDFASITICASASTWRHRPCPSS